MKTIVIVMLLIFLKTTLVSQEVDNFKNTISFAPFCIYDKTISVFYSRKLSENVEFIINPRIRKGDEIEGQDIKIRSLAFKFLNKEMLRVGFDLQIENFFFEPLFQYANAHYNSRLFKLSELYFKSYNSIGAIALTGLLFDVHRARFRVFVGAGYHKYYFNKISNEVSQRQYEILRNEDYSVHAGVELGFRF